MAIDLEKRVEKVKFILDKREINDIPCQVKLAIDRSGSMDDLYYNGTVQDVVERILAIGMKVDIDKSIDIWAFHNGSRELPPVTEQNLLNFVNQEIVKKISSGGTSYAPVMEDIIKSSISKNSLFGMFKKKEDSKPTLAIFITDGESNDENVAEKAIKNSQDKNIYWMLVGIGNADFRFIERLGEDYPNCGFIGIDNISKVDDEDLFDGILNEEFAKWVKKFK